MKILLIWLSREEDTFENLKAIDRKSCKISKMVVCCCCVSNYAINFDQQEACGQCRCQPKNVGGPNLDSLLVSSRSYNIHTWDPLYIKILFYRFVLISRGVWSYISGSFGPTHCPPFRSHCPRAEFSKYKFSSHFISFAPSSLFMNKFFLYHGAICMFFVQ